MLVTSVFVTPIVTKGNVAKPCRSWAAAAVGEPVSFREKETGAVGAASVPRGEVAAAKRGRSFVCRDGQINRVGIHHS